MARPLGTYPFPYDMRAGVYRIDNKESGVCYIGSALNFYRRWRRHHNELNKKIHSNEHLSRAWERYGVNAFQWSVIEVTEPTREALLLREQYWLEKLKSDGVELYNTCVTAGSQLGVKRSKETKQKMSAIAKKRGNNNVANNEEWRQSMKEMFANTIKMSKGQKYKRVRNQQIDYYLNEGWSLTR